MCAQIGEVKVLGGHDGSSCPVCACDATDPAHMVRIAPCGHRLCAVCAVTYVRTALGDQARYFLSGVMQGKSASGDGAR